jgi:endoribonuclease LACTB2
MATPRPAAAVILTRQTPDLEIFWVRRGPTMMFQGGFHGFPGGQLDPQEDARTCAARELFEEVGVRIDPSTLMDLGRWITPAFYPRRFDTVFFLAPCPEGEEAGIITEEHDLGEWIRPADAIANWQEGRILMAPPVRHALQCLALGLNNIQHRMKTVPGAQGEAASELEARAGISMVPVRTPTLPPATHTNCYILGRDEVVVIDPASPYPDQQKMLDKVLGGRHVREIWLTHLHADHVGGANHLRERTGAKIVAHPITAESLRGTVNVDRIFEENERLELGGSPKLLLDVLHTPGHARGHVCIFEEKNGSLIAGDLVAGLGTIVIDPPEGHMATYLDSLRRMKALDLTALFPAHGPIMANAKGKLQEYLDHRKARENDILKAWTSGFREIPSIVATVYTDVPPAMHALAQRSVMAHLEKLEEEGKI